MTQRDSHNKPLDTPTRTLAHSSESGSPKKGKAFPNVGKKLPRLHNDEIGYEKLIAAALHRELGGSGRAIKTLERWTGATPRSAKNWLSGSTGPSGAHLMMLLRYSDEVFKTVLAEVNRERPAITERIAGVRLLLADAISILNG
jgi:hypothetical protein